MLRVFLLALVIAVPSSAKVRTWTDSTGKYTVQAEFVAPTRTTSPSKPKPAKPKSFRLHDSALTTKHIFAVFLIASNGKLTRLKKS